MITVPRSSIASRRAALLVARVARQHQALEGDEQQRRQEHGQGHHQRQHRHQRGRQHAVLRGVADQHEAELAGLRQAQGEQPAIGAADAEQQPRGPTTPPP
jgi:hypothetical protein